MNEMFLTILIMLFLFQVKHFMVDYIWQFAQADSLNKYNAEGWEWALFKHANQHAMVSVLIVVGVLYAHLIPPNTEDFMFLIFFVYFWDLILHGTMDRLKASPYWWGKFKYPDKEYFQALGVDQAVHHLTHYGIIAVVVTFIISQGT